MPGHGHRANIPAPRVTEPFQYSKPSGNSAIRAKTLTKNTSVNTDNNNKLVPVRFGMDSLYISPLLSVLVEEEGQRYPLHPSLYTTYGQQLSIHPAGEQSELHMARLSSFM